MAVNIKKFVSAGAAELYYGTRDSDGYLKGGTDTAPTAGDQDGSPTLVLDGLKSAPHTVTEPETVTITGDDGVIGEFVFEAADLPTFILEMGSRDFTFQALCEGTAVHDDGDFSIGVIQPAGLDLEDMVLIITARAKSRASGSLNATMYEHLLIPNAQIVPISKDGFNERDASSYRYSVTCNSVDQYPWGLALSVANNGVTECSGFSITTENKVHLHRFTGDGTVVAYNLDFTPSEYSDDKILVYVDGVKSAYTSGFTASGTVLTFASAPASGAKIVVFFEHT